MVARERGRKKRRRRKRKGRSGRRGGGGGDAQRRPRFMERGMIYGTIVENKSHGSKDVQIARLCTTDVSRPRATAAAAS